MPTVRQQAKKMSVPQLRKKVKEMEKRIDGMGPTPTRAGLGAKLSHVRSVLKSKESSARKEQGRKGRADLQRAVKKRNKQ